MSARDELFGGMWNGLSDEEANRRIDAYKAEVLRDVAKQLTDSAVVWDGIDPVNHVQSMHRADIARWFREQADIAESGGAK